jgi:hypothetical protein
LEIGPESGLTLWEEARRVNPKKSGSLFKCFLHFFYIALLEKNIPRCLRGVVVLFPNVNAFFRYINQNILNCGIFL